MPSLSRLLSWLRLGLLALLIAAFIMLALTALWLDLKPIFLYRMAGRTPGAAGSCGNSSTSPIVRLT
jgi:hypothetical protein